MSLALLALAWVRISTLVAAARSVFGWAGLPPLARLGLSAGLALLVWPQLSTGRQAAGLLLSAQSATNAPAAAGGQAPVAWAVWAAALAGEVAVGLAMAFGVEAIMAAAMLAGQLADLPMGFSVANVVDPTLQQEVPLLGQFYGLVAVAVLFGVNGHHEILRALVESLRVVPPGQLAFHPQLVEAAVGQLGRAFVLGLRMGAPVLGVLFLTDVALAVVARAVPQLNLFVVGFPVKLGLGLAMVMLALPAVVSLAAAALGPGGMLWEGVAGLVWAMGARR